MRTEFCNLSHGGDHFNKVFAAFDKGSSATLTADVEIDADEFERIANTDYTRFDESVPEAAMQRQPDEDEAGVAAMGDFRFGQGVRVGVSCKAVLNGGELMVDDVF